MRLFFAINPPDDIKRDLDPVMNKVRELNHFQSLKWVKTKSLHLTLHFLGEQTADMADKIINAVNDVGTEFEPIHVRIGEWGGFPNLKFPRVIFFTLEDAQTLFNLHEKIGFCLEQIGIETENRAWQTHITVARNKNYSKPMRLALPKLPNFEWPVRSFELMKSNLSKDGAEYEIVESFKLGK